MLDKIKSRMNMSSNMSVLVLAFGVLLILTSMTIFGQISKIDKLTTQTKELSAKMAQLDSSIAEGQVKRDVEVNDATKEATGLHPEQVTKDSQSAEKYFNDAFNWDSGATYDKMRQSYSDKLGKDNTFTKTYLTENITIELNDGKRSYIDHHKLKSHMEGFFVVPVKAEGKDRISYVAFVTYFMYKDETDLVNLNALSPSEAVIEFTIDSNADGKRSVVDAGAWSGYSSALELE